MSSQAYTPGLKRKAVEIMRKTRRLPIEGRVLVEEGEKVSADTIVATTSIPGSIHVVDAAGILKLVPVEMFKDGQYTLSFEIYDYMLKKEGDDVEKGEVVARLRQFFGLINREFRAPVKGKIEKISDVTGKVLFREPPVPLNLNAYVPGKVVKVLPGEGVIVELTAAFIQGIFGIGGETRGEVLLVSNSSDEVLNAEQITPDCAGKIVVGGAQVTGDALSAALKVGAKGIIVGGIACDDLRSFLGYDVGVAITGHEKVGLTLIITEGLGKMAMSEKTFSLLREFNGRPASINGATQIRAGVIRPEIIIPREEIDTKDAKREVEDEYLLQGLLPGTQIRIIREPYFGAFGRVVGLPPELRKLETEADVRVLEAEIEGGKRVIVPRANVEIIEE